MMRGSFLSNTLSQDSHVDVNLPLLDEANQMHPALSTPVGKRGRAKPSSSRKLLDQLVIRLTNQPFFEGGIVPPLL